MNTTLMGPQIERAGRRWDALFRSLSRRRTEAASARATHAVLSFAIEAHGLRRGSGHDQSAPDAKISGTDGEDEGDDGAAAVAAIRTSGSCCRSSS